MSRRIGYGQVFTRDQPPGSQQQVLAKAGCGQIFIETGSGRLDKRPQLEAALAYARRGDVLVITRFARAANNLRDLIDLVGTLNERGIDLIVLEQGIDTTTPTGRQLFPIAGAFGEFRRELVVESTHTGLATARARGRTGGRPATMTPARIDQARRMYDERGVDGKRRYTVAEIAESVGVSRATIYRHLEPGELDGGQAPTEETPT